MERTKEKDEKLPNETSWDSMKFESVRMTEEKYLEEIEPILNLENRFIMGHGTGSSGDNKKVVYDILEQGLSGFVSMGSIASEERDLDEPVGSTDLYDTAVGLQTTDNEQRVDTKSLAEELDHWKHRDSKNIILMSLPMDYIHMELGHEKFMPFFVQSRDESGQMRNYVDTRFIIGCYDRDTKKVLMNNNFVSNIDGDFKEEMDRRLEVAKQKTEERIKREEEFLKNRFLPNDAAVGQGVTEKKEEEVDDSDWIGDW